MVHSDSFSKQSKAINRLKKKYKVFLNAMIFFFFWNTLNAMNRIRKLHLKFNLSQNLLISLWIMEG